MLKFLIFVSILQAYEAINAPVIGILTQPTTSYNVDTYLAASYVKFLESGGAKVIPIWINQTTDYYERVINYTNGVLFPGGDADFDLPGGYGDTAKILYHLAKDSNDNGRFFPLWGTCLGFEVLPFGELGIDIRVNCSVPEAAFPLYFEQSFNDSRLFQHLPEFFLNILLTKNVTFNSHHYCLTETALQTVNLDVEWNILTSNYDSNNMKFISTMEHKNYPFYGIQYHPEKNPFEFNIREGFPHSFESVLVAQYFSNFFVSEARKSENRFSSNELELKSLIYNYCPQFTALNNNYFEQIYGFNTEDYANNLLW